MKKIKMIMACLSLAGTLGSIGSTIQIGDFVTSYGGFDKIIAVRQKLKPSYQTSDGNNVYELESETDFKNADYTFKNFDIPRNLDEISKETACVSLLSLDSRYKYYTAPSFESDVKKDYLLDLNYSFNYDPSIGNLKVNIQNVRSKSIRKGFGIGAYFEASYGVDIAVDTSLGLSVGSTEAVIISCTYSMDNRPSGNYSIGLRFYTCTKYFFKINLSSKKVEEILEVKNLPSVKYQYEIEKK